VAGQYSQVESADLDGDGFGDLVLAEGDGGPGGVDWWRNPGGADAADLGKYTRRTIVGQSRVSRVHATDLDGDGKLDLLGAMGQGDVDELRWWRQEPGESPSAPGFAARPAVARFEDLMDASAADLDHDGDVDLLALTMRARNGGPADSKILWLKSDGAGGYAPPVKVQDSNVKRVNDGMWTALDVGDVNGDGGIDFVAAEPVERGVLCWYENPSPAVIATQTPVPSDVPPSATPSTSPSPGPSEAPPSPTRASPEPTATESGIGQTPTPSATPVTRTPPVSTTPTAPVETTLALPWLGAR
jgi:hypothetical protein